MNTPNKEQKAKHAIKDINNSDSIADILAYIVVDDRQDVVDAAKLRIAEIDVDYQFPSEAPGSGSPAELAPGAASPEGEQPMKQGQVETITRGPAPLPDLEMITKSAASSSVITIRGGKAVTVKFDEKGKEITE